MEEKIIKVPVIEEMQSSFLDYAMSVITDRAIPLSEDGLKPVHRRLLWTMYENKNFSNKPYVKCASPVGKLIASYHPHGDSSAYGALVKLSQPWNMRYPLIDFHGANGSRDGDEAASMRYTECRLSKYAELSLRDIKSDTVDFVPNFDDTLKEPVTLTGAFPHLLCNGTIGIAVSVSTSFFPHNLNEVLDAATMLLKDPNSTIDDLLEVIKGPDFPTGGIVINKNELKDAYKTGKGRARVRGEYHIETIKGYPSIVFTSIPYKVSKEDLTLEIDKLCEEGKIKDIVKIRDESARGEVRFVITLSKNANPEEIVRLLFHYSKLETTISYNMVALVNKQPVLLNLIDLLNNYLHQQKVVLVRKTLFEKSKLEKKLHILKGIIKALEDIDNVIKVIKNSSDTEDAKTNLKVKYLLDDKQAQAIVDMKLGRLAKLEKVSVQKEIDELTKKITEYNDLLNSDELIAKEMIKDLIEIKNKYGDKRITTIDNIEVVPITKEKKKEEIPSEDCVIVIEEGDCIKRVPSKQYKTQNRNSVGTKNKKNILKTIKSNTVNDLMIFTSLGKVYKIIVNDIPENKATYIGNLITLSNNEKPIQYVCYDDKENKKFVFFATKQGRIKKVLLEDFNGLSRSKKGIIAIKFKEDDSIADISLIDEEDITLFTNEGMGITLKSTDIPSSTRVAIGVKGMTLKDNDYVIACAPVLDKDFILVVDKNGKAKRLEKDQLIVRTRGGKGLIYSKEGLTTGIMVNENDCVLITGDKSSVKIQVKDIPVLADRASSGVILIKNNSKVISVSVI